MTVEEFYAFTDTRPDDEKWELIDGEPILNASPSPVHQWIVGNLIVALGDRARGSHAEVGGTTGIGRSCVGHQSSGAGRAHRFAREPMRLIPTGRDRRDGHRRLRNPLAIDGGQAICAGSVRPIPGCLRSRHYVVIAQDRSMSSSSPAKPDSRNVGFDRSAMRWICRRWDFVAAV